MMSEQHNQTDIIDRLKSQTEFKKQLAELSNVNTGIQISTILADWLVMLLVAVISVYLKSYAFYVCAVFIIASRQHALLVMMHEAAHFRIAKNRELNDGISDFLCSYPTLMTTQFYRAHHLKHHQYTNMENDPDWARKRNLNDWQFPKTRRALTFVLAKSFFTGGYDWLKLTMAITRGDRKKIAFWLVILGSACLLGQLTNLVLYWFVPLLTVFPLLQRIRSIAEHFGIERNSVLTGSRDVKLSALVSFLFAPHSVHWHLTHHLFPSIPQYKLEEFHDFLMADSDFRKFSHLNHGYFCGDQSMLSDLTRTPIDGEDAA